MMMMTPFNRRLFLLLSVLVGSSAQSLSITTSAPPERILVEIESFTREGLQQHQLELQQQKQQQSSFSRKESVLRSSNHVNPNPRRHLEQEVTFDEACGFLIAFINEGSGGNITCTCDSATNTFACSTPSPICDPTGETGGACASLEMEISFLDSLDGLASMSVCVDYSGNIDPAGPYRDGCVSATFTADGQSIATCTGEFADESGTLVECQECSGCADAQGGFAGFRLDCSNIYPGAVADGCYDLGGSAEQATGLFPAVTNGTVSGGGGGPGNNNTTDDEGDDNVGRNETETDDEPLPGNNTSTNGDNKNNTGNTGTSSAFRSITTLPLVVGIVSGVVAGFMGLL